MSKILFGLDELRWDAAGQLIDADGRLVNCVWKTWAWETAIEQVREVSAEVRGGTDSYRTSAE